MPSWLIGSSPDCDLVVPNPTVSAHHCRLTIEGDAFFLEDLGSTNGTYVNGQRLAGKQRLSRDVPVTLGLTTPMPWPETGAASTARTILIGREPDNDVVLDDARVSGHHARIVFGDSGAILEDLGSTNGTFLNNVDRKITRSPLSPNDTVYFGSYAISAARLLSAAARPAPAPTAEVLFPPPPMAGPDPKERSQRDGIGSAQESSPLAPQTAQGGDGWIELLPGRHPLTAALLLIQAPLAGIIISALWARTAASDVAAETSIGIAAMTFALALGSVWLGCTAALCDGLVRGSLGSAERRLASMSPEPRRVPALAAFVILQCVLLSVTVQIGGGLKVPWLSLLAWLTLAGGVGLALGLVLSLVAVASPGLALTAFGLSFALMLILGSPLAPPAATAQPLRLAAGLSPPRWAFEALLLAEAARRPPPADVPTKDSPTPLPDDLAERSFPAATDRMGPIAAATALSAMLIGLMGVWLLWAVVPSRRV